ncbi:MAG: Lamin Tail Domain/Lamin Tail Domain [Chloroflexi bacterium]|nr:MAG: Lamin Tail Domain/Lamin Tail Domain [Chloroflexota bacterium]
MTIGLLAVAISLAASPWGRSANAAQTITGLQLTEVLADAGRGSQDAAFEWVEIANLGPESVDLEGWRLADNRAEDAIPAVRLASGARVVVGGSALLAAELPGDVALVVIADGRIGNGLANSGDRVVLISPEGEAVDGVSWGSDRTIAVLSPPVRGQSLARDGEGAWGAAAPSPGAAGEAGTTATDPASLGPLPEVRISEVFASAGQVSNDAAFEWVELRNEGETPVDLAGWTIEDNSAIDEIGDVILPPGGLLVIGGGVEAAGGQTDVTIADGRIGNGLANDGDVVTLRDAFGRLVDEADYRAPPLPRPEEGRSIALTDAGWVLNTDPSPGSSAVTPLLASLVADGVTNGDGEGDGAAAELEGSDTQATDPGLARNDAEAEDGGGIPAAALVAVALGVPLAAIGGRGVWRSRGSGKAVVDQPDIDSDGAIDSDVPVNANDDVPDDREYRSDATGDGAPEPEEQE